MGRAGDDGRNKPTVSPDSPDPECRRRRLDSPTQSSHPAAMTHPAELRSELVIVGGAPIWLSLATACAGAGLHVPGIHRPAPARTLGEAFDTRTPAIAFDSPRI